MRYINLRLTYLLTYLSWEQRFHVGNKNFLLYTTEVCYLMTTFPCPSDILVTSSRRDQDVRRTSKRCH